METSFTDDDHSYIDSNISKFARYNKNTSSYSLSKVKDESTTSHLLDNDKRKTRGDSSCNLRFNPANPSGPGNSDDLTPKIPQDLLSMYTATTHIKMPSNLPHEKLKLAVLDLSSSNLINLPEEVLTLDTLRLLRLDYNYLTELPANLPKLLNLEILTVAFNRLKCLPPTISGLSNLKELNLESNEIEVISDEISGLKSLRVLSIFHNPLSYLPCSIRELACLKEFSFEWFHYTKPQLAIIQKGPEGQGNIEKLRKVLIDLHRKKMKGMSFRYFLEYFSPEKPDLTEVDSHDRNVFHHAVLNEDISVLKYLIQNFPQLKDSTDKDDLTPLALSLLKDKNRSLEFLMTQNVNVIIGGGRYGSPLHMAAKKLNLNLVTDILKAGADSNRIDSAGNTPLHYAVGLMASNFEAAEPIVKYLMDHDSNCNAKNKENWTPLHLIARKGAIQPLEWMVSYNSEAKEIYGQGNFFNLNKKGGAFKWTALHIAAYTGSYKMVEILGEARANFFVTSSHGYAPKAMLRRDGVTLKLIEKYEKLFIQEKFHQDKSKTDQNAAALQGIQSALHKRKINGASKNKFVGTINGRKGEVKSAPLSYTGKIISGDSAHGITSKLISKSNLTDQADITPEAETRSGGSSDFNKLTDMGMIDKLMIASESPIDMLSINSPLDKTKGNILNRSQSIGNRSIKQKNYGHAILATDLNLETYEQRINNNLEFGVEFCKSELAFLIEHLISSKVGFTEKIKQIFALRILHNTIVSYLCKNYKITVAKDSLPMLIHEYQSGKNLLGGDIKNYFDREEANEIMEYYNLVPNGIVNIYTNMEDIPNNFFVKQHLIKLIGDLNHFASMSFLQSLGERNESVLIVIEAKRVFMALKSALENHKPHKMHQELLKKQYSKTLMPKLSFSLQLHFTKSSAQLHNQAHGHIKQ